MGAKLEINNLRCDPGLSGLSPRVCPKGRVEEYLGDGNNRRDQKWTNSIAVGSKGFVESIKKLLGAIGRGRKIREAEEAYQLREPSVLYGSHFGVKNDDMGSENTYYWNVYEE